MNRTIAITALLLTGCDTTGTTLKVLDAGACVVADETLQVAFKDPPKAQAWLERLDERLSSDEEHVREKAIDDAAKLAKKLAKCIPDRKDDDAEVPG